MLYLGRIDYTVIFPALVAGIVAHLVCGVRPPFPSLQTAFADTRQVKTILIMLACGALFGLIALLLIESLRFFERTLRRFERRPYLLAAAGGVALVLCIWQPATRTPVSGPTRLTACWRARPGLRRRFLLKILATSITLETGGSGGIVTPIFFVGATSGAALAPLSACRRRAGGSGPRGDARRRGEHADRRRRDGDGTATGPEGVYAALAASTAFLMVGHRSVYASQKIGLSKSAGLDMELGGAIGDVSRASVRIRKGSLTDRVHRFGRSAREDEDKELSDRANSQNPRHQECDRRRDEASEALPSSSLPERRLPGKAAVAKKSDTVNPMAATKPTTRRSRAAGQVGRLSAQAGERRPRRAQCRGLAEEEPGEHVVRAWSNLRERHAGIREPKEQQHELHRASTTSVRSD